jgi:hypothetical protein
VWLPLALAVIATGCGRFDFDPLPGASDTSVFTAIALPSGGRFDRVAIAADGSVRYVLAQSQGVFRSDDGGATWTPCERRQGFEIAVDAAGVVYLAGDDVYASTDACTAWIGTGLGPTHALLAHADGLYAGTDVGVRLRANGAWSVVATPSDGYPVYSLAANPAGAIIAGATLAGPTPGIIVRASGSQVWTSSVSGLPTTGELGLVALGITATGVTPAYASFVGADVIFCSADAGATWGQCFDLGATAILPSTVTRDTVIAGVYDDLIDSTNRLATYNTGLRAPNMHEGWVKDLARTPAGALVAVTETGVFEAAPGTYAWQEQDEGLDAWSIDRITVDAGDVFLAAHMGLLRSVGDAPFEIATSGMTLNTEIFAILRVGSKLFAGGRHLRTSSDDGATWNEILDTLADGFRIQSLANDGTTVFAGTAVRVLRSSPPYTTWTPTLVGGVSRNVSDVRVRGTEVWAATDGGVFVSTDGAVTFQPAPMLSAVSCTRLALLPDGRIAAGTADGVWLSDATASTWTRVGFPGVKIDDVIANGSALVAIANYLVYVSRDDGVTWTELPGFADRSAHALAFDSAGAILVGTNQNGLWRAPAP